MDNIGIPANVRSEKDLALLSDEQIMAFARPVIEHSLNFKQHRAIRNFTESSHRLARKRIQATQASGAWQPFRPGIPSEDEQHALYDLEEGYFQGVYNTLSKLAAVTVVFPEVFPGVPFRSMEKFLRHFAKVTNVAEACSLLERARFYRTHLDHPAGTPVSNWLTARFDNGRGLVVYHFGHLGQSGKMPEGTEPLPQWFPTPADWYIDPPFLPYIDEALVRLSQHVFHTISEHLIDQQAQPAVATPGPFKLPVIVTKSTRRNAPRTI